MVTKPKIPKPPKWLGPDGRAYFKKIHTDFVVEPHQFPIVENAALQVDRAAQARAVIAVEGITTKDRFGQIRTHPSVDAERAAHLAFTRIQRELGLDVAPPPNRGPARPGTRN